MLRLGNGSRRHPGFRLDFRAVFRVVRREKSVTIGLRRRRNRRAWRIVEKSVVGIVWRGGFSEQAISRIHLRRGCASKKTIPCRIFGSRRRRRSLAVRQGAQAGNQARDFRRRSVIAPMQRQLLLDRVPGLQHGIHDLHGQRQLPLSNPVEQGLGLVREIGDIGEAEHAGTPFHRVRSAEDRVERLLVRRGDVDLEQQRLHAFKVLLGLLEKNGMETRDVDAASGIASRMGIHCLSSQLTGNGISRALS